MFLVYSSPPSSIMLTKLAKQIILCAYAFESGVAVGVPTTSASQRKLLALQCVAQPLLFSIVVSIFYMVLLVDGSCTCGAYIIGFRVDCSEWQVGQ